MVEKMFVGAKKCIYKQLPFYFRNLLFLFLQSKKESYSKKIMLQYLYQIFLKYICVKIFL